MGEAFAFEGAEDFADVIIELAGTTVVEIADLADAPRIDDGTWHHLAMTVDLGTSTMNLYVDGLLADTQNFSTGAVAFPGFNNFEIGRLGRSATKVDGYTGLVDDVQVYNTALSASDVAFLAANPGVAVPEPTAFALAGLGLLSLFRRRRA